MELEIALLGQAHLRKWPNSDDSTLQLTHTILFATGFPLFRYLHHSPDCHSSFECEIFHFCFDFGMLNPLPMSSHLLDFPKMAATS